MSGCGCDVELKDASHKVALFWLLGIYAVMFFVDMSVGIIANAARPSQTSEK
jgi:hypothetical protein